MLTSEEKKQIREEIRRELSQAVPQKRSKVLVLINSAFFVTFVGALLIALMGHLWQTTASRNKMNVVRWQTLQDRKYALLGTFCHEFESSVMVLATLNKMRMWLVENKDEPAARDEMGRSHAQTLQEFKELWILYGKQQKPNALFAKIKASFDSDEVFDKVDKLDKVVVNMQKSQNKEQFNCWMGKINKAFADLAHAMGKELKSL